MAEAQNPRGAPGLDDPRLVEALEQPDDGAIPEGAARGIDLQDDAPPGLLGMLGELMGRVATPQPRPSQLPDHDPVPDEVDPLAGLAPLLEIMQQLQNPPPAAPVKASERWEAIKVAASDVPRQAVGRDPLRMRLQVTNRDGTNTVYLSSRQTAADSSETFDLQAGETLPIDTADELWVVCSSGETATLRIIAER